MKRELTVLRFAVAFVCVLMLISVVGFSQDDGEKTWDDVIRLVNEGMAAYTQARFLDAIDLFEEALVIVRELDESILDEIYAEGVILNNLGLCYYSLSEYQRAIEYHEQSLAIFREFRDRVREVGILYNLGNCYRSLFDYQKAIDYYEQALVVCREIPDRAGEAEILYSLGCCYKSFSDYQQAIDYYEQALTIDREIKNQVGEAASLNNLGGCYYSLCDYQQAIEYHEQSLAIDREIKNRTGEAASLNNLGICYECLSDFQRAIDYHEQSLTIFRKIPDRAGEAVSLNNLGNCYYSLSEYQQAIDYHEQSLAIKREIKDAAGEANSLGNLGLCYCSLSAYQRAIGYHEQSLEIFRKILNRTGEAASLNNLGVCYRSLCNYPRAIQYHEQALVIFHYIKDKAGEADSLMGLGNCHALFSNDQRAIDYYEQALAIKHEIKDRVGEVMCLVNLGNCYYSLSDYQRAVEHNEQALALSVELGTRETEQFSHWGLGRTYKAMEQPETALTHYEAAIEIVESIRGAVSEEELRQSYFGSVRTLYEEYLKLLLEMGQDEETVLVAERLRARTFLDGLYQAGLAPEQLELNEAGIVTSDDVTVSVVDAKAIEQAVAEAQASLLANEAALEYMVTDDGIYLWILTSEGTLGPEFIRYDREQLLRDVVALRRAIEPQTEVVDGQPKISFSDPSELLGRFYKLLIQQPVLSQLSQGVNTLIIIPSGPLWYVPFSALVMTDCPQVELGSASVPGSTKQYRPRYLIDNYTLAFLPSLASLPMLMEERAPSTAIYLALANPTLSEKQQKEVGSNYQFSVLEAACLAFAECIGKGEEAVHVQEANVHVKEEALEARAYNEAAGHEVLVYACHGIFNPSVPLDSRLLLAPSQGEEQETTGRRLADGDYYAYEVILTDHEGVDLVILAACETLLPTLREVQGALGMTLGPESDEKLNMGQLELIVAGDEVVGLSRAFLSSGAQSVLGTLWQASPRAIEKLLVSLGEHSQANLTWAQALCQAQQELIANENFDNVWFWGAYQLVGRWRSREPASE